MTDNFYYLFDLVLRLHNEDIVIDTVKCDDENELIKFREFIDHKFVDESNSYLNSSFHFWKIELDSHRDYDKTIISFHTSEIKKKLKNDSYKYLIETNSAYHYMDTGPDMINWFGNRHEMMRYNFTDNELKLIEPRNCLRLRKNIFNIFSCLLEYDVKIFGDLFEDTGHYPPRRFYLENLDNMFRDKLEINKYKTRINDLENMVKLLLVDSKLNKHNLYDKNLLGMINNYV
jgi:hypothetical protein